MRAGWTRWVGVMLAMTAGVASGQVQTQYQLVGAAAWQGERIRLTPALPQTVGAAWVRQKQRVRGGFEAEFQFQITQTGGKDKGSDGFAFVVQNQGPQAIGGRGSAGGFAFGDDRWDWRTPGIATSLAIFFDTHRNGRAEPSDNYIAICTHSAKGAMKWPPERLGVTRRLRVRLKDGQPHHVRVRYRPPLMTVFLDSQQVLQAPVAVEAVTDPDGMAHVGFTASTGDGFQNHDVYGWSFTGTEATSLLTAVDSRITFMEPDRCLAGRNLCTPAKAEVVELSPGRYRVVLPAHLPWGAGIPNPANQAVQVRILGGQFCLAGTGGWVCGAGEPLDTRQWPAAERKLLMHPEEAAGALLQKTENGRTVFSMNAWLARFTGNEGFIEFEAIRQ